MTPAEFALTAEGYRKRDERELYRAAWMVSYLLQPHLKKGKRLSPDKLLGKTKERAIAARKAEQ